MLKNILLLLFLAAILILQDLKADVWYFGDNEAVNLTDKIKFENSGVGIITGEIIDPTIIPYDAKKGTVYIKKDTAEVFVKKDDGNTINWARQENGIDVLSPLIKTTGALSSTISIQQSSATLDGYLSSIDWNYFNDKVGSFVSSDTIFNIPYFKQNRKLYSNSNLFFDETNGHIYIKDMFSLRDNAGGEIQFKLSSGMVLKYNLMFDILPPQISGIGLFAVKNISANNYLVSYYDHAKTIQECSTVSFSSFDMALKYTIICNVDGSYTLTLNNIHFLPDNAEVTIIMLANGTVLLENNDVNGGWILNGNAFISKNRLITLLKLDSVNKLIEKNRNF